MDMRIVALDCRHPFLSNSKSWLHCIAGESIIGSLSLEAVAGGEWVWVNDLFVEESSRRKGIAKSLIVKAVSVAPAVAPHACGVNAGVRKENLASIALFGSLGFQHVYGFEEVRVYSLRFDSLGGDDDHFDDEAFYDDGPGDGPLDYLERTAEK